jgi:hypothetical protein
MYAEETLLIGRYAKYAGYRARTARVIPFVLLEEHDHVYSHRRRGPELSGPDN